MLKELMVAMLLAAAGPATASGTEVTAPGPNGALAGTLVEAGAGAPVVLILPGSGPTDRDGNSPLGITAAPYRLLAEALATRGVASVRVDKRGLFGSRAAITDPNAVTIAGYADDTHAWAKAIRARTGAACVWLLGHSEGGLVALQAAQRRDDLCGVILVSAPGRPAGDLMREQLRASPAFASAQPQAMATVDALEAGRRVDVATLPAPLPAVFNPAVQGFVIDLFAHDPAALAHGVTLPLLIVQGDRDIQVSVADARALAAAQPHARPVVVPGVNHVLKAVASDDRRANTATYADPSLPVAPGVVDAVAGFVKGR